MVELIRGGVPDSGGTWADLGAGSGNFTWALSELLGSEATIYAIDRDARAAADLSARRTSTPPRATMIPLQADVMRELSLPPLDGVLMANLLHFIRDQAGLLRRLAVYLKPGGRLLVVEYEQTLPLPWVPFPVPFPRFSALATSVGYLAPALVGTRRSPSSGRVMYAAVARRVGAGGEE